MTLVHKSLDGVVFGLELVQFGADGALPEENPSLDPPRKDLRQLVVCVCPCGHCKDIVQLFQRALHGLREEQEDHNEGNDVQGRVEAERTLDGHCLDHSWERQRQNCCPEIVGGYGP